MTVSAGSSLVPVVRPSPELSAISRRWIEAIWHKDERTLTSLFSASESLTFVGTAVDEMWSGAVLRDGFGDHVREVPNFEPQEHHVEAFECGGFGWALWIGALQFSNMEQPALMRVSLVFVLEYGLWKITQLHSSNPSRNIDIMGVEHRALDTLVSAAREGFRQVQSEGMASVMFTDIANSTSIAEVLGDRKWAGVVAEHMELVGGVINDNGGRVVKSLGDGTMSTFVSAHDVDFRISSSRYGGGTRHSNPVDRNGRRAKSAGAHRHPYRRRGAGR